ncbi:MAG: SRPBCC domain-containing protein, partial [Candidatus Pacebacteria bacterium]|nr:SRPBCC domain-containing protein [Candidatus Paceibacterota bacterium]
MKKTIETTVEIKACPEKVWAILSDSTSYGQWNPFIRSISGAINEGSVIKVVLNPPGGGSFTFKPMVLKASFPEIRWRGKFLFNGLFDGEHYFRLESVSPEETRFIHGENFSGLFIRALGGTLEKTKHGF